MSINHGFNGAINKVALCVGGWEKNAAKNNVEFQQSFRGL
jgi:hypothetical protein